MRKEKSMDKQVIPGVTVSSTGEATVDPSLKDTLFDLAINLEAPTNLPVDIEHVLAAIVLAARQHEIDSKTPISADDEVLIKILTPHVKSVFQQYGGNVGSDNWKVRLTQAFKMPCRCLSDRIKRSKTRAPYRSNDGSDHNRAESK